MKHKWLTVLLALIAAVCLCFGLAACGGNGGNGGTQTEQGSTENNQGSGGDTSGDTDGSKEPEGQGGDEQKCKHEYTAENVCSLCGDKWEYTEGLNYVYNDLRDIYIVGENPNASGDVVIPYGYQGKFVTTILSSAFKDCSELTGITIPSSVTTIGRDSFYGCYGLTEVHITDLAAWCKIEFIDVEDNPLYYAHHLYLDGKEVKELIIPDGTTSIRYFAFSGCEGLTSVTIPDGVTAIMSGAFYGCYGLTSVTIGNGVTLIGEEAFYLCIGLTSVTIGSGVTKIWDCAFNGCIGLTRVDITDLAAWCKIDFEDEPANPLWYAHHLYLDGEEVTTLTIPEEITQIKAYAFYHCEGLASVTIPDGVTSIGSGAFWGCTGLTRVDITDLTTWCEIDFGDWSANPLRCAHHLYLDGEEVTTLTIPEEITEIKKYAFLGCSGLTRVTIHDGVTSIGEEAFYDCTGLTSITIPEGVTSIGYKAFYGCSGLTRVDITDLAAWCKIDFGDNPLFYAHHLYLDGEEVKELIIPEEITQIKANAFSYCTGLTSVTIIGGSIGDYAFSYCTGLTSVTIGSGVTEIGGHAFSGCTVLTDIQFKGTVAEWQAIKKGGYWCANTGDYTVTCTDGKIDSKGTVTYFE